MNGSGKMSQHIKEFEPAVGLYYHIGSKLQEISSSTVSRQDFIKLVVNIDNPDPAKLLQDLQIAEDIETNMDYLFRSLEHMTSH